MANASSKKKRSKKSNGLTTHAFLFVASIALLLIGKADITAMNSLRGIFSGLTVPVVDVISVPFRAVYSMMDSMTAVANLREENLRLKEDIQRLQQHRRKAEVLQSENRQLRSVSGAIIPAGATPISARVIALNAGNFAHSVMVNVGKMNGIRKGNAVTTNNGLVGFVVDVGPKHSQILLLTDINAMIPVILSASSWPATTAGLNSTFMDLRFLSAEANVKVGDLVQTSGHGGVLPPGIPVGRINSIQDGRITVAPVVDLKRLSFVTILTLAEDPGYAVDDLLEQSYQVLPPQDEGFSLEGLNALGQRSKTDVSGAEGARQ